MPTLVHLADEKETSRIKKNGIKPGRFRKGVFCMPVLPNFYVSHQWLRELKTRGVKTYVGVYFKLSSKELVYAGRYGTDHKRITLGEAIKEIMKLEDPLGYELIISRKIEACEITGIKSLPQKIGWRFMPKAKGRKPCACEYCLKSSIKANRIKQRLNPSRKPERFEVLVEKLKTETDESTIEALLDDIKRKQRKADPTQLLFLLQHESRSVVNSLTVTLAAFKHPNTEKILVSLLTHEDSEVKAFSTESLLELKGKESINILDRYKEDPVIRKVLED